MRKWAMEREEDRVEGDTDEDWKIYRILCQDYDFDMSLLVDQEEDMSHDMATSLRSELAALQYKRDRLLQELQDMKGQLRSREQKSLELQVETEQLKEQSARQNAIIASLRKRIQELEDKERTLSSSQGRAEMALQTLQRENHYQEEKVKTLEKKLRDKVRTLELECHSEEVQKENHRKAMEDLVRRLSSALGAEYSEAMVCSPEGLVHKASELVQETSRLRSKSGNICETLSSVEVELRNCKDALDRALADRDSLQRQAASHLLELDRLRQEKENLEMQQRVLERDLAELREKLTLANRSLSSTSGSVAVQEATICQLREDLKTRDEKLQRVQNELRHLLETLAIQLSSPARFVESTEPSIRERLREVLQDNKDKSLQIDNLREKVSVLSQQLNRQSDMTDQAGHQARNLQEEKALLESRLHKLENDLSAVEMTRDGLRRDKNTFMTFLERLARALNIEEMSKEVGVDLHTESLLLRAEQLARLESDKLLDKYLYGPPYVDYYWWKYGTYPRLRRERSFNELPLRELRTISQSADQERTLNEHNHQILREELTTVKQSFMDCQRRENALLSFRTSVMKLLGLETPLPDYEVISRLQKVVQAHRDFTLVSRRYEDPLLMGGGSRTPLLLGHSPAGTRTPRYDDSGFVDPPDLSVLDDSDEVNGGGVYGKRGVRSSP